MRPRIGTTNGLTYLNRMEPAQGCQADALKLNLGPTRHPVNSRWGHQHLHITARPPVPK